MATTILTKFVRHFYGYDGVWDEYKSQVVNRIGNRAFIWLLSYVVISTVLAMAAAFQYENAFWALMVLNVLVIQLIGGLAIYAIKEAGILDETITKANLKRSRKVALRRWLGNVIQFIVTIYVVEAFLASLLNQQAMTTTLLDHHLMINCLWTGLSWGVTTLIFRLITLKPEH